MSFHPYDSADPTRTPPSLRPIYGQQGQYGAYDQPQYGAMGYGDIPQQHQHPMRYPPTPGLAYPPQTDAYMAPSPSFSPTASQFAAQPYATGDPDAMSYQVPNSRRRYQSTGGSLQSHNNTSDIRHPMPRRPSADMHMPVMHESFKVVPSQPDFEPTARSGHGRSSSSSAGTSAAESALALERPYECDLCHTRFARQHDCRRHRETHAVNASGEKPHHCVVCGKSFTRKDALKRHTNQKGCDITMSGSYNASRSSRSSSSPQQAASQFYPIGSLPHSSSGSHY
ncbi:C2H2 zinc finger [Ceratobasidium sp. AG-Ba]|nr:C2H2 zinc finger [Ceratobasidium sp. AG-Ba]